VDGVTPAPPYAPLGGIARDENHMDVFYVDNAGRVVDVTWDTTSGAYHASAIRPEPGAGGENTAPAGTAVSVFARSSDQIEAFLADRTGTALWFEWTSGTGWSPSHALTTARFPPGAPLTAIAHHPPDNMELFGVTNDGTVWNVWCGACDGTNWVNGPFLAVPQVGGPMFRPGTQLAAMTRNLDYEDVFGVDVDGHIWRAWWVPYTWQHPNGYEPFARFGGQKIIPSSTIATCVRSSNWLNLMSLGAGGAVYSEWFDTDTWYPAQVPWEAAIVSDWQTFPYAQADSVPAMLGNLGQNGSLDVFWHKYRRPGQKLEIFTSRWPVETGIFTPAAEIDNRLP
jgi:hypothetical protein